MARFLNRRAVIQLNKARNFSGLSKATLPDLDYDYGALEPYISGNIMELHHSKHHQTYVNNFNAASEQLSGAVDAMNTEKMIGLQSAIKFNGGGHINHSIFWKNLAPVSAGGGGEPGGELGVALKNRFGDFEKFKSTFSAKTAAVQV